MSQEVQSDCQHVLPVLLSKMSELGILQASLTADRTQVLTATRLRWEVKEALVDAGGRATAPQLAAVIGMDHTDIMRAIRDICNDDCSGCYLIEIGDVLEILTTDLLDLLLDEANRGLSKHGWVTLEHLSKSFDLPIKFIEGMISKSIHDDSTALKASKILNGFILTESYESTKRHALRAACAEATRPCPVKELIKTCELDQELEEMALSILKGLVQDGELRGTLTGGSERKYTPDAFVAKQHEMANNFFTENGYLDQATAASLQVRKLQAFVKDQHPTAVCLETVAVSKGIVEQLEAVADEAVAQESWFEAFTVLPTSISDADATHLVGMCTACRRAESDPLRMLQLEGVYGVSLTFAQNIVHEFREYTTSTIIGEARATEGKDTSRSGSSARKGGGKERRRKGRRSETGQVPDEEVRSFISSRRLELEDHPRLLSGLAAQLTPSFCDAKVEAIRLANEVKVSSSREQVNTFETVLESCYHAFQCHSRGVQALGQALRHFSPADTGSSILINASQPLGEESRQESSTEADPDTPEARAGEYLLSTQGAQLAAMITTRECEKLGIPFSSQDRGGDGGEENMPIITPEARSALVEVFPGDVGTALANLWEAALIGGRLSKFRNVLEEQVFPTCNLIGRRLDKRRERQLFIEGQRAIKEKLFKSESERDVHHFATLLVFQSITKTSILLPRPALQSLEAQRRGGESWSKLLLRCIRGRAGKATEDALVNLQHDIEASEAATAAVVTTDEAPSPSSKSPSGGREGENLALRLLRSTEAARALSLKCGDI